MNEANLRSGTRGTGRKLKRSVFFFSSPGIFVISSELDIPHQNCIIAAFFNIHDVNKNRQRLQSNFPIPRQIPKANNFCQIQLNSPKSTRFHVSTFLPNRNLILQYLIVLFFVFLFSLSLSVSLSYSILFYSIRFLLNLNL